MLHLTSLFQNASKLNNPTKRISHLNKLNRNYSFIYNQNLDRYDFVCHNDELDDYEANSVGYFGCFRDKKADRRAISATSNLLVNNLSDEKQTTTSVTEYDGYWGLFKDHNFTSDLFDRSISESKTDDKSDSLFYFEPSDAVFESASEKASSFNDEDEEKSFENNGKTFETNNLAKKLVYDYKRSKFKIEAGKRDKMKVFIQNLEDREMQLKKEIIKPFDSIKINELKLLKLDKRKYANVDANQFIEIEPERKTKRINFLHFSNKSSASYADMQLAINKSSHLVRKQSLDNFKNAFNILSKLNKSINIFNGNYLNIDKSYLDHFVTFFNVNASLNDLNGLLYNLNKQSNGNDSLQRATLAGGVKQPHKSSTISLFSNIYDKNQKPLGHGNHLTMLFEHNNVKIGFIALVDQIFYNNLCNHLDDEHIEQIRYVDFVLEANRLSEQLRLSGAHLIVVLVNFDDEQNEQRLLAEAADIDLVFSSRHHKLQGDASCASNLSLSSSEPSYKRFNNRWLVKSSSNFDSLSLVNLNLDELNGNKIVDVSITKYYVE